MNMCLRKQNYGTSEHADNAQLAVLCKITTEEEQGGGEVALLCHFQIHNCSTLLALAFFLNKSWSSGHSFSCLSNKILRQNTTLIKVLLPVCIFTSTVILHCCTVDGYCCCGVNRHFFFFFSAGLRYILYVSHKLISSC